MRDDFSASADRAQLVFGAFMLSVVISQLISGSLSDRFGRKKILLSSAEAIVPAIGFAFGGVIAEFVGWRSSIGIMVMGGLLIAVMSDLFIDESRRGDPVLFRLVSLIAVYLALLKTSGVMLHGLTSGLAVGMFFVMGGAMLYAFHQMGIGPLGYGLFFAITSIGYILGNFINGLLVGRVGIVRMVYLGSLLTALAPMLMLAGC